MFTRSSVPGRVLRAGVVGLTLLTLSGLGLSPAAAAPAPISLDDAEMYFGFEGSENFGGPRPVVSQSPARPFQAVPVAWGGSVTVVLPAQIDASSAIVSLGLRGDDDPAATLSYTSDSADPLALLMVTPLGGNQFRVDLPADDGVNGPNAELSFIHLTGAGGVAIPEGNRSGYGLRFEAAAPAAVTLAPQLIVHGAVPDFSRGTTVAAVSPGRAFQVTLPAGSRLSQLGVADLRTSDWAMTLLDDDGGSVIGPRVRLSLALSPDGRTATLTVPRGTAPGTYDFSGAVGDGTDAVWAGFSAMVEVRAGNFGLRSNTDWNERTDEAGLLPLVALGAGMIVVAGGATVLVLRRRPSRV
jgi:hypothetical protein